MNYFTPERWLALQHVSTREAFDTASANWQQALTEYRAHLERIRDRLPPELRALACGECLHDSVVTGCWSDRDSLLLMVQRAEGELGRLEYELTTPVVRRSVLPPDFASGTPEWMYDQVGVEEDGFTHDILLRDGTELAIRFSAFRCSLVESLLPLASVP